MPLSAGDDVRITGKIGREDKVIRLYKILENSTSFSIKPGTAIIEGKNLTEQDVRMIRFLEGRVKVNGNSTRRIEENGIPQKGCYFFQALDD